MVFDMTSALSCDETKASRRHRKSGINLYEAEFQRCMALYRRLGLERGFYVRSDTCLELGQSAQASMKGRGSGPRTAKTAPLRQLISSQTSQKYFTKRRQSSCVSQKIPSKGSSRQLSIAGSQTQSSTTRAASRPSISRLRSVLIEANLPTIANLPEEEDDDSVFTDSVVLQADLDPLTKVPRKTKRFTPNALCDNLLEGGYGDPREKATRRSQNVPDAYLTQASKKKMPFYMEKLKGKSRLDCDMANARAVAFCEQQMQNLRTASANWRHRFQRFIEERQTESDDAEDDGDNMANFSVNNGVGSKANFIDENLESRIKTWIEGVELAQQEKRTKVKREEKHSND